MTNSTISSNDLTTILNIGQDNELMSLKRIIYENVPSEMTASIKTLLLVTLKRMMQTEIVHFRYEKSGGEERSAYGTRNPGIVHRHGGEPKVTRKRQYPSVFTYFDIGKKEWRSFRPEKILTINMNYEL